jgi:predicted nucleic acid-binding protein
LILSSIVVADTSVLINFLKIDRMDLIGAYPRHFLATDHVADEIVDAYPEQQARYQAALAAQHLDTCSVTHPEEVALFTRLGPGHRLGAGECSAIAVALHRGLALAIDDNRAVNRALREAGLAGRKLEILRTQDVIVALIRAGVLDVAAADRIKDAWANQHRFRIKAASFSDLL